MLLTPGAALAGVSADVLAARDVQARRLVHCFGRILITRALLVLFSPRVLVYDGEESTGCAVPRCACAFPSPFPRLLSKKGITKVSKQNHASCRRGHSFPSVYPLQKRVRITYSCEHVAIGVAQEFGCYAIRVYIS